MLILIVSLLYIFNLTKRRTSSSVSDCAVFVHFYAGFVYHVRYLQVSRDPSRFCYTRQQCGVVEDVTNTKLLKKEKKEKR